MDDYSYFNDYSTEDYTIERIEKVLTTFDKSNIYNDVNEVIELFLIRNAIENKRINFPWSSETYELHRKKCKLIPKVVLHFFSQINECNIAQLYESVVSVYKDSFWDIIVYFKIHEKWQSFTYIVNSIPNALHRLLRQKEIVVRFGNEIADIISTNIEHSRLIFDSYIIKQDTNDSKIHIPKELDDTRIIKIIENYIDWERANSNYLKIISCLRKVNNTVVSEKIRFKAKKKYTECVNQHSKSENYVHTPMSISVEMSEIAEEVVKACYDDSHNFKITYDKKWFRDNLDYPTLLNNFIHLFEYTDIHFRCQFISNPLHMGIFENLFSVTGNNEYKTGIVYRTENVLSVFQMHAYRLELLNYGITLENIFKWFFEEYLSSEFGVNGFKYIVPSDNSSNLEKVLIIITQIEAVIKQFRLYVQEGCINREFFEFSSASDRITFTPSMIERKYVYANNNEVNSITQILFGEQSLLLAFNKDVKYDNLVQLLMNEKMTVKDFPRYASHQLKLLVDSQIIYEKKWHT